MPKITIAVRGVDADVYRRFKARAVLNNMKLGDALTLAMKHYLEKEEKKRVH